MMQLNSIKLSPSKKLFISFIIHLLPLSIWWKTLFILFENLLSFSRYLIFCLDFFFLTYVEKMAWLKI